LIMINISAMLQPTEDPMKVSKAIMNLFGDIPIKIEEHEISASLMGIKSLEKFKGVISQDRIRDTLRNVFTRWSKNDLLSFGLNRQAAFAGHVSLNLENEDPMGPIRVEIKGELDGVIRFLCVKS
jgi:predicted RNA binding protein with dsRBD fold (UPF0201 family)